MTQPADVSMNDSMDALSKLYKHGSPREVIIQKYKSNNQNILARRKTADSDAENSLQFKHHV